MVFANYKRYDFCRKSTYGDFLKSSEKIATNILATRLLQLEENGLIEKKEHPDSKVENLYRLTSKGIGLVPIFVEMLFWAEQHELVPSTMNEKMALFRENKESALKALVDKLSRDNQ